MNASMVMPVERREWEWVGACAAVLAGLVALPYAIALLRPPDGFLLQRTLFYGGDLSQYLAAMGDGASSASWSIQDHLTAEVHSPAFMYPFYVFLGKAAALFGIPPLLVFAFASLLAIPALVFAAYGFAAAFTDVLSQRMAALIFVLFASGFGIWIAAAGSVQSPEITGATTFAYDRAEVSSYLLPFGPPHLTFALALMLVWGRALASWSWGGGPRDLVRLVGAVLAVSLLNPFSVVTMLALSGGYAALRWIVIRRIPARELEAALIVALAAAPALAANLATFALDPFWSVTYGQQNTTGSPPVWALAVDFGFVILLAAVGLSSRKVPPARRQFLAFWALALLFLMYAPVGFQRRFGFGLQPALAVLAAIGAAWAGDLLCRRPSLPIYGAIARLAFNTAVVVCLFSGTILGYSLFLMAAGGAGPAGAAIFEPASNVAAADWLASHTAETDVVLASVETSNFLAGKIRGRVVVAHKAGTLNYTEKVALMKRFFAPGSAPGDLAGTLAQTKATVIFVGDRERALGGRALSAEDGFRLIYDSRGVQLYRSDRASPGRT